MDDKIFFKPGDVVRLRLAIPSPSMLVIKKEKAYFGDGMLGLKCRWFTTNNLLLEAIFNTKDLILVK